MFTAVDTTTGRGVTTRSLATTGRSVQTSATDRYRCLACGESLAYRPADTANAFGPFAHPDDNDCLQTANVSKEHRVTQELVAAALLNWLPVGADQVGIERRIGTASDFLIGDVVVGDPIRLGVEIVYDGTLELQRRMARMEDNDYIGSIVVVSSGRYSAARLDTYLERLGGGRVGRCNPITGEIQFGSVLVPSQMTFDTPGVQRLPEYVT